MLPPGFWSGPEAIRAGRRKRVPVFPGLSATALTPTRLEESSVSAGAGCLAKSWYRKQAAYGHGWYAIRHAASRMILSLSRCTRQK
jgi:hypothetical protein